MAEAVADGQGAEPAVDTSWIPAVLALRNQYARGTIHHALHRFAGFQRWCVLRGVSSLPAASEDVRAYVEEIAQRYRPSMVRLRVEVIRKVHMLMGHADPTAPLGMRVRRGAGAAGEGRGFMRAPKPDHDDPADPPWVAAVRALRGAYAPKTISECLKLFRAFEAWCAAEGRSALPADAETVAAYVAAIFPRMATSSVKTRLAFIRKVHQLMRCPDPTRAFEVKTAFRRGLRAYGAPQKQAVGMSADIRDRLRAACPDTLLGLRDRAMISLGYDTLCRRFELVGLRAEDLTVLPDGTASIRVRRTKGSQVEGAQVAYISRQGLADLCAWLSAAGIARGVILRPVYGRVAADREMAPRAVNRCLELAAAAASLEPDLAARLTGHSMRVGAAQDLAIAGRTLLQIMRAGRWSSLEAVAQYARAAKVNVWSPSDDTDTFLVTEAGKAHRRLQAVMKRGGEKA